MQLLKIVVRNIYLTVNVIEIHESIFRFVVVNRSISIFKASLFTEWPHHLDDLLLAAVSVTSRDRDSSLLQQINTSLISDIIQQRSLQAAGSSPSWKFGVSSIRQTCRPAPERLLWSRLAAAKLEKPKWRPSSSLSLWPVEGPDCQNVFCRSLSFFFFSVAVEQLSLKGAGLSGECSQNRTSLARIEVPLGWSAQTILDVLALFLSSAFTRGTKGLWEGWAACVCKRIRPELGRQQRGLTLRSESFTELRILGWVRTPETEKIKSGLLKKKKTLKIGWTSSSH